MSNLIKEICEEFSVSERNFVLLCSRAPRKYKRFQIPKRSGGQRSIAQPSKELKKIQKWLVQNYFMKLPIHPAAMAYIRGVGIRSNAEAHAGNLYLYKFDFRDFFPSIKPKDFHYLVSKIDIGISNYEAELVSRLIFWDPPKAKGLELSIGAPSSPIISNAIMYEFDSTIGSFCEEKGLVYTRYADDICISGDDEALLKEAEAYFKGTVFETKVPRLAINPEKTLFINAKSPKKITGLSVTENGHISAGRKLKRKVRALMHQHKLGQLSDKDTLRLQGYINYLKDVDPDFANKVNPEGASIIG